MPTQAIKPDGKLRIKYLVTIVLVFAFFFFPWVFLAFIPGLGWGFVVIFLLANLAWMVVAAILVFPYYDSIAYELRDDEVIVRKGIITKTVQQVPYRAITNVEVKRGPLDRLLGIGGVHLHTAGYSQQPAAEAVLAGLPNYDEVEETISQALRRYRARADAVATGAAAPAPAGEASLDDVLGELRRIRAALEGRGEGPAA